MKTRLDVGRYKEAGLKTEMSEEFSEEVQMRSIKPNLIAAANAMTLAKLQLKVLMGITADMEIKINDNLTNYETTIFANQLKEENVNLNNNTTMKQLDLNMKLLEKNVKSLKTNFMPTLSMICISRRCWIRLPLDMALSTGRISVRMNEKRRVWEPDFI